MAFFHKDNNKTITHKRKIVDRTMQLSRKLIEPHMQDFDSLSHEDKRERISDLTLAMVYAIAVLAHIFLKTTPKEFGSQIGKLLEATLRTIKEYGPSTTALLGVECEGEVQESSWD